MLNISVYDMTFTTDTTIPYNCPWYLQCHGNAGESDNTYNKKVHDISGSHFFFKMTAISSRIQALHWTMNSFFFWLKIIIEVGTRISSYLINGFSHSGWISIHSLGKELKLVHDRGINGHEQLYNYIIISLRGRAL